MNIINANIGSVLIKITYFWYYSGYEGRLERGVNNRLLLQRELIGEGA